MAINNLYKMLDRMESVIMDGVPIPLLPFSLINQEKLIVLLDKIQTVIPDEIQQADQILRHKEEIIQETQRQAQHLINESKRQSEIMLGESELMKAVHLEAERVRQQVMVELQELRQRTLDEVETMKRQAYEESLAVRQNADEYADTVLKNLSQSLEEFQVVSKEAQKQLRKTRVDVMKTQHGKTAIQSSSVAEEKPLKRQQEKRERLQEKITKDTMTV